MKPNSIVHFERLYLASLAIRAIGDGIGFNASLSATKANPLTTAYGPGAVIAILAVIYLIALALWYFVVRGRSVVAKWVIAAWFVIATCSMALGIFSGAFGLNLGSALATATFVLLAWSTSYLFKPDADAWFAKTSG